jgi:hypothetical protein
VGRKVSTLQVARQVLPCPAPTDSGAEVLVCSGAAYGSAAREDESANLVVVIRKVFSREEPANEDHRRVTSKPKEGGFVPV